MRSRGMGVAAGCVAALAVDEKLCGKACRQTFKTLRFEDVPNEMAAPFQECSSHLHLQGLYLCWRIHCTTDARIIESRSLNQTCRDLVGSSIPPYSIVDGFTDEDIARIPRFNATSPDHRHQFHQAVLPSQDFYELWSRTLDANDYVHYYHYYYGWAMGVFWAVVVAVGMASRALMLLHTWPSQSFSGQNKFWLWLKRNVITPATFSERCVQDFGGWGTLPPRLQTLTLLAFILVNAALSVHGYKIFEGNMYYPSISMQILRHVSDRTGIISFANFPLIWLFGMRNNLIIWLTGWSFGTYNSFHRWVARVATIQAIIHSVGYTVLILRKGGWEYFSQMWGLTFWWTGEMATILMSLLLGLSAFWIRRRQYELFLVVHITFSILILITMLGHVWIFKGAYDALVLVPVLLWLLDRVLRGVRILVFNPVFWDTYAQITYNERAHMIRMVVPLSSSFYRIRPGTFYYISLLNRQNFWQSHPFTVASIFKHERERCPEPPQESAPLLGRAPFSRNDMEIEAKSHAEEMTFLIRPYDSFTSRLKEYAVSSWPMPVTVRVAIDGPYGRSAPLQDFDKLLFVIGGSGIAVPLSYLEKLMTARNPPRIYIHWAVQHPALALDVLNIEMGDALSSDRLRVNIYITQSHGRVTLEEASCRCVEWRTGRMNIEDVVDATLNAEETGSLGVVACGPASMADSCRKAVTAKMMPSLPKIEYFEESFQW